MTLNLIDAFSYYLVLAFVTGTVLRARNYRAMVGLVYNSADRWPKLRALVETHRAIFLRWPTVLPLAADPAADAGERLRLALRLVPRPGHPRRPAGAPRGPRRGGRRGRADGAPGLPGGVRVRAARPGGGGGGAGPGRALAGVVEGPGGAGPDVRPDPPPADRRRAGPASPWWTPAWR